MVLLQGPRLSYYSSCPYLQDELCRFEYFYAHELDGIEMDEFLKQGWRKFGTYYFRPECGSCRLCVPIRIPVRDFVRTKNQRRVMRKCGILSVQFKNLEYRDEIYEIYRDHSLHRFARESVLDEFIAAFYTPSCPSLQSEYYLNEELIAVGFIDVSLKSLSSVYFAYKSAYDRYSLGTYSVLREVEHAASIGLEYYYLGYYVEECRSMAYKNLFYPNEKFDWFSGVWTRE